MENISIVLSGPKYNEFSIDYSISILRNIFKNCEVIISTNDKKLVDSLKNVDVDKVIFNDNIGELPSLKFPTSICNVNNNINKQIVCNFNGIAAARNKIVLKLRTDQIILDESIIDLWNQVKNIPKNNKKKGRIITSSIFSINPRYNERMVYHISDMLQFGFKEDLLSYYSAPLYPYEYSIWYEKKNHAKFSTRYEKAFRSRYAVEQWLTLHYIYGHEANFPIKFHNDYSEKVIEEFEIKYIDYFIIAHPSDINLRASKFIAAQSFYNNQCYSTYECLKLLERKYPHINTLSNRYKMKGIDKNILKILLPVLNLRVTSFFIKLLNPNQKKKLKAIISKLTK